MNMRTLAVLAAASVCAAAFSFTAVNSSAALGANDYIDWGQVGVEWTNAGSSYTGTTNLGLGFTIESVDNTHPGPNNGYDMLRLDEGGAWSGEFQPGDRLLYNSGNFGPGGGTGESVFKITFASAVFGCGTQAQSNAGGAFTSFAGYWTDFATLNNVGYSNNSGFNSIGGHSGSAYTGGYDTVASINEMFVVAVMDDFNVDNLGFAIGQVDVLTRLVPEPGTMAVLGLGALALMRRRK